MLREHGVEPEIVEYLKDPPTAKELDRTLAALEMEPRDLMRKREKEYKELGLSEPSLTRDQLIAAMVEHPRLIERPIGFAGKRVVLGRPTDAFLELL